MKGVKLTNSELFLNAIIYKQTAETFGTLLTTDDYVCTFETVHNINNARDINTVEYYCLGSVDGTFAVGY